MVRVYAADPHARINLGIRRRLAPLLGNNRRKIELIHSLLLSLPGTPILYYGDEIGMGDNIFLGDRNGVRTPMQWSPDRNGGFSSANPQRLLLPLIIDPEYHYETVNAENQQRNLSSLFWWMRRTLAVRKNSEALAHGEIEFLQPENAKVLAYLLHSENETVLVVASLSRFVQVVELDLRLRAGAVPRELFGNTAFPVVRGDAPMVVTLGPHGFYWFALRAGKVARQACDVMPTVPAFTGWSAALKVALTILVLPCYLPRCAWFRPAGRTMRECKLVHIAELQPAAWLVLVEVSFQDGQPETYVLPIAQVGGAAEKSLTAAHPSAIIARIEGGGVLADALFLPEVRERWLRLHLQPEPALHSLPCPFRTLDPATVERIAGHSRFVEEDRANTSIAFGDALLLKVYRRFEPGTHPEVELLDALQRRRFPACPPIYSAVALTRSNGSAVVSSLHGCIAHQGDGWQFTLDALSRFFDRALASRLDPAAADVSQVLGGVFPERMRGLGQSMAALHRALADAFAPEPFGPHYQHSLCQAMRGQAGRVLRLLRKEATHLTETDRALAARVMENRAAMLRTFAVLLERRFGAAKTRVHGDLHLGQLLNTGKEFVFINFDGEASRPIGERGLRRCPLVDLAAMLRSLDAAAAVAFRRESEGDQHTLRPWAGAWVREMGAALSAGYFSAVEGVQLLPPDTAGRISLLEIFLLDRALWELSGALLRRSESVGVSLKAVADLLTAPTPDAASLPPPSPASPPAGA
jgi:maltose alpha-D-glucosyltransferase/alpha-amylase